MDWQSQDNSKLHTSKMYSYRTSKRPLPLLFWQPVTTMVSGTTKSAVKSSRKEKEGPKMPEETTVRGSWVNFTSKQLLWQDAGVQPCLLITATYFALFVKHGVSDTDLEYQQHVIAFPSIMWMCVPWWISPAPPQSAFAKRLETPAQRQATGARSVHLPWLVDRPSNSWLSWVCEPSTYKMSFLHLWCVRWCGFLLAHANNLIKWCTLTATRSVHWLVYLPDISFADLQTDRQAGGQMHFIVPVLHPGQWG